MDDIIDNLYVNRELYSELFMPICAKYHMTKTEMLVLLFLSHHSGDDTATHIVDKLKITKSHVSASVRDLEKRGYLQGRCDGDNRRMIHLQLCDDAAEVIRDAEQVQREYLSVISRGFTEEEMKSFVSYITRMNDNANWYLKKQLANRRS